MYRKSYPAVHSPTGLRALNKQIITRENQMSSEASELNDVDINPLKLKLRLYIILIVSCKIQSAGERSQHH